MANTSSPRSNRFKRWYYDAVNDRLEYWYNLSNKGMQLTRSAPAGNRGPRS